jgi:peptide/nickel transport system substrate-binding protein
MTALPRGGTLVIGAGPEMHSGLTSAVTSAGTAQIISAKLFDGLLSYDEHFGPQPQLATSWDIAEDGLSLTLHLRRGVTWHDGKPFTSRDVAFSAMEVWKKYHSRGRTTFANVVSVDTPDSLTAVLRLSQPAPYLLGALTSSLEAQVIPEHIYAGTDVTTHPANAAPIGTGPFRFVRWEPGDHVLLERNPDYWDAPRPWLDKLLFRFIADPAATSSALENSELHLADDYGVSFPNIARLSRDPNLVVTSHPSTYNTWVAAFEFNLDRPIFKDLRVRQAFAHAFDRDVIVKDIWHGHAEATETPIPPAFPAFHSDAVPRYTFDLAKAEALLEAAGFKRDALGVRLTLTAYPEPTGALGVLAVHLRENLRTIGVCVQIHISEFGNFVDRTYTARDFDTIFYSANAGPDPAIGVQRFYWSKNFKRGVAFSNASNYRNAEVDRLLEEGQTETDPKRRRAIYAEFQRIVQTDLPRIPLLAPHTVTVARREVLNFGGNQVLLGNFSDLALAR